MTVSTTRAQTPAMSEMISLRVPYPTGFLDLSPELRNKIYELALISLEPIRVHYELQSQPPKYSVVRKKTCKATHTAALLRTCKAIYEEGAPVLYGNNVISVSFAGQAFKDFIEDFRRWKQHIRFIQLEKLMSPSHFINTLAKCKELRSLKMLRIGGSRVEYDYSPKKMAKMVVPLVNAFMTGENARSIEEALRIPNFGADDVEPVAEGEGLDLEELAEDEVTEETTYIGRVRAELKELMELPESKARLMKAPL